MIDRERKVDINRLSELELKSLEVQLGDKIRQICDEACQKSNKLLNVYGLHVKMNLVIAHNEPEKGPTKRPLESAILKNLPPNL